MYGNVAQHLIHLHGTLAANASGVIPMLNKTGAVLLEAVATASNASDATLTIGAGSDPDAYLTAAAIGQSGELAYFTVADFDGVLADSLGLTCPQIAPGEAITWSLDYDGDGGTAAANVDIVVTLLLGGVYSDVSGLAV